MEKKSNRSPDDMLETYFKQIKTFPLLTFEDELELSKQIQDVNTNAVKQQALHRLVSCNLRLVVKIALLFNASAASLLDMIQEGNLGLIHAAEKYDHRKNVRFSTYASWWIRRFISRFISVNATIGRLSYNAGVREDMTARLIDIHEDYTYSPERDLLKQFSHDGTLRILNKLRKQEKHVLSYRYQLDGCRRCTLQEIGDELDISSEAVRQIEMRALKKIRSHANELKECMYIEAI